MKSITDEVNELIKNDKEYEGIVKAAKLIEKKANTMMREGSKNTINEIIKLVKIVNPHVTADALNGYLKYPGEIREIIENKYGEKNAETMLQQIKNSYACLKTRGVKKLINDSFSKE